MSAEYPAWRLIVSKVATLSEIENHYSYDDVMKMNAILDMKSDLEAEQLEHEMKKSKK